MLHIHRNDRVCVLNNFFASLRTILSEHLHDMIYANVLRLELNILWKIAGKSSSGPASDFEKELVKS